jgi:hypothetical protein
MSVQDLLATISPHDKDITLRAKYGKSQRMAIIYVHNLKAEPEEERQ